MAKTQRMWVIEGETDSGHWMAMSGYIFDNKRTAFQKLRDVRQHWKDYPPQTFRIVEYRRVED